MSPILVFVTAATEEEARKIASLLVEERFAACVNFVPGVVSTYRWKGTTETSSEVALTIKTSRELWPTIQERIRNLHSYECPEIIAIPVVEADPDYLKWWEENLIHNPA